MEGKNKSFLKNFRFISYITQFSLSLVSPLVLCLLVCYWLVNKYSFPQWIMLIGIFLGVGAMVLNFIKMLKWLHKESENKK